MKAPTAGFIIVNDACQIIVCDLYAKADDLLEWSKLVVQEALEDGDYWSILQTGYKGRRLCRLVRMQRLTEMDAGDQVIVTSGSIDARFPLDESFSEQFRFSMAEWQRPNLAAKGVPAAVIDAFILSQVEPLSDSISC